MECSDNCLDQPEHDQDYDSENILKNLQITSLSQRKERLRQHHRNLKTRNMNVNSEAQNSNKADLEELSKSVCYHDNEIHQFNSTWSPLKCIQCACSFNSIVDCYVYECPSINCPNVSQS